MTLDETQKKADEINRSRVEKYCPIIKEMCRTDCTCYIMADKQVIKRAINAPNRELDYELIGGFCECFQLTGPMEGFE